MRHLSLAMLGLAFALCFSIVASANDSPTAAMAPQCMLRVVRLGQDFHIELSPNPSTGYSWEVENTPDDHIVEIGPVASYRPPTTKRLGAAGSDVWQFKAVGTGVAVIAMKYARQFDKPSVPPAKEAFYVVVVR